MKINVSGILKGLCMICLFLPATSSCGSDDNETPEPAPTPNPGGSQLVFKGTTTTYPVDTPENLYTSTKSTYTVTVAKDAQSAVMGILDADFLQGMPPLGEMIFQPIECIFDANVNTLFLNASSITPEIAGRPFPAFPITDYTATIVPDKNARISFVCTYRGTPYTVNFSGTSAVKK